MRTDMDTAESPDLLSDFHVGTDIGKTWLKHAGWKHCFLKTHLVSSFYLTFGQTVSCRTMREWSIPSAASMQTFADSQTESMSFNCKQIMTIWRVGGSIRFPPTNFSSSCSEVSGSFSPVQITYSEDAKHVKSYLRDPSSGQFRPNCGVTDKEGEL